MGPVAVEAVEALEVAVDRLVRQLPRPLYLGDPPRGHFRYAHRTSQTVQVLKAVRVVSGFWAAMQLGRLGFHQEASVVLRAVDEALQDIDVLDEAHHNPAGATEYQQKLVEEFFQSDDAERMGQVLQGAAKPVPRVPRKKKRAAVERRLLQVPNSRSLRPELDAVDAVLDGYVHSGYAQIMEMYSASPVKEGFRMRGIHDPGRAALFVAWLPRFVHHALNAVAGLLMDAKLNADAEALIALRKRLETSREYEH